MTTWACLHVGFPTLLALAEQGVRVKASGFGRVNFDVGTAIKELYAANPDCLMFGTDLPSTRAARPYSDRDFRLVTEFLERRRHDTCCIPTLSNFTGSALLSIDQCPWSPGPWSGPATATLPGWASAGGSALLKKRKIQSDTRPEGNVNSTSSGEALYRIAIACVTGEYSCCSS